MRNKFQISIRQLADGNWTLDIRNWKFASPGFTLIELMIVISMISILAAGLISLIDPLGKIQRANDAKRKTDLSQIQRALEVYYDDNQKYPVSENFKIKDGLTVIEWGQPWGTPPKGYMAHLPKDPVGSKFYVYNSNGGKSYTLHASLDNKNDPQKNCGGGDVNACNSPSDCGDAEKGCDYGVSSPNISP